MLIFNKCNIETPVKLKLILLTLLLNVIEASSQDYSWQVVFKNVYKITFEDDSELDTFNGENINKKYILFPKIISKRIGNNMIDLYINKDSVIRDLYYRKDNNNYVRLAKNLPSLKINNILYNSTTASIVKPSSILSFENINYNIPTPYNNSSNVIFIIKIYPDTSSIIKDSLSTNKNTFSFKITPSSSNDIGKKFLLKCFFYISGSDVGVSEIPVGGYIVQLSDSVVVDKQITHALCNNEGSIKITSVKYSSGFSVSIKSIKSINIFNSRGVIVDTLSRINITRNLSPGTYKLQINFFDGDPYNESFTINPPPYTPMSISNISTTNSCPLPQVTGKISLEVVGGKPKYKVNIHETKLNPLFGINNSNDFYRDTIFVPDNVSLIEFKLGGTTNPYSTDITVEYFNGITKVITQYENTYNLKITNPIASQYVFSYSRNKELYIREIIFTISDFSKPENIVINNLNKGNYKIQVCDSLCYKEFSPITINTYPKPAPIHVSVINPICSTEKGGVILKNNNYKEFHCLEADLITSSNTINNLDAGSYKFYYIDQNGCNSDTILETLHYEPPQIDSFSTTSPICAGDSNAILSIIYNINKVDRFFIKNTNINWTDTIRLNGTNSKIENLKAGKYQITPYFKTCAGTTNQVEIEDPPVPKFEAGISITPVSCHNETDGVILLQNKNNYSKFILNDSILVDANIGKFSQLTAGNHRLKAKDSKNCITTDTTVVIPNKEPISANVLARPLKCFYDYNTGSISISNVAGENNTGFQFSYSTDTNSFDNWSVLNNSININDLNEGRYYIKIRDSIGCNNTFNTFISRPPKMYFNANVTPFHGYSIPCYDDVNQAKVIFNPRGGTGGLRIWNNNDTSLYSISFEGLWLDTAYVFHMTDSNFCRVDTTITLTKRPEPLSVMIDTSNYHGYAIRCKNGSDGRLTITPSGGVAPYYITVSNTTVNDSLLTSKELTINDLPANSYTIKIIDANQCSYSRTVILHEPTLFTGDIYYYNEFSNKFVQSPPYNGYTIRCKNLNTLVNIKPIGGVFPYFCNWDTNSLNFDTIFQRSLKSGTYSIFIKDNNNCFDTLHFTLNEPDSLKISSIIADTVTCYYNSDGKITVQTNGGVLSQGNIKYILSTKLLNGFAPFDTIIQSSTTVVFDNLKGNEYNLIVEDANQCRVESPEIDIRNLDTIRVTIASYTEPSCFGGNDGQITLTSHIINNPSYNSKYNFTLWKIDKNQQTGDIIKKGLNIDTLVINQLQAGYYGFMVTDILGCTDSNTFELKQPSKMAILIDSIISNRCFNDYSAQLKLSATGGVGGYKFSWNYDNVRRDFNDDPADTTQSITLSQLNWNFYNTDNAIPYIISLRDKNYKSDQPVCTITDTIFLPKIKRIKYSVYSKAPSCMNGNDAYIRLEGLSGGKGSFNSWKIKWFNQNGHEISNNYELVNIEAGNYRVLISDSVGCTSEENILINNPVPFTADLLYQTESCNNSEPIYAYYSFSDNDIKFFSYDSIHWFNLDSSILQVDTSVHRLFFKNKNGCIYVDSVSVSYAAPKIDSVNVLDASTGGAKNGKALLFVSCGNGNNTYLWTFPDKTIKTSQLPVLNNLAAGKYFVQVIDNKGKHSEKYSFIIQETNRISILFDSVKLPVCEAASNGYLRITVNSPSPVDSIVWAFNNQQYQTGGYELKNLRAGNYSVLVIDSAGNRATTTYQLNSLTNLNVSGVNKLPVSCNGGNNGNIIIHAAGGSGNYRYTCNNGMEGMFNNKLTFSNLKAGSYQFTFYDSTDSKCQTSINVTIPEPPAIKIQLKEMVRPICRGGDDGIITVEASGGNGNFDYYWPEIEQHGNKVSGLKPGLYYTVNVTDILGCNAETTFFMPDTTPIEIANLITNSPLCNGNANGSIQIDFTGGRSPYMIEWMNQKKIGKILSNISAGEYKVKVTDANGCVTFDTIELNEPAPLIIDTVIINPPSCWYSQNASIHINASGGTIPYQFKLNKLLTDNNIIHNLTGGYYTLTVSDRNSCSASIPITIPAPEPVDFEYQINNPTCYGYNNGKIFVQPRGGKPPYVIKWLDQKQNNPIENLIANIYAITIKDSNQCFITKNIEIKQPEKLTATVLVIDENPCYGDCKARAKIIGYGGTYPYSYQWDNGLKDSLRNNLCMGSYSASVQDRNNCNFKTMVSVKQPSKIKRDSVKLELPACFGGNDGKIVAYHSGGTGNLKKWIGNKKISDSITNISAGTYYLRVKDENNCEIFDTISLTDPPKESITRIAPSYQFCIGQIVPLYPGNWQQYWWYNENKLLHQNDTLWINTAGNYAIKVMSYKGCYDSLQFKVDYSSQIINTNYLLSHDAIAGEEVQIIDVSWPIPDKIEWTYSTDSIVLIENSDDRQRIIFKYPGEYPIMLTTYFNSCIDSVKKNIVVYASPEDLEKGNMPLGKTSDIIELQAFPNPTEGNIHLYLKLIDKQNTIVEIYNITDGRIVYRKELSGNDNYQENINISAQSSGIYGLRVTTAHEVKTFMIIKL